MKNKIRIGVIFGGRSSEHEVSVRSARSVIEAVDVERYEVVPIAITREGRWLSPAASAALLPEETSRKLSDSVSDAGQALTIVGDPSRRELLRLDGDEGSSKPQRLDVRFDARLDVVFPVLHGTFGEDGTIQGLLEMAGIPYVGCGVLASSCGMDKTVMKKLFSDAGLPICEYVWFLRREWESKREQVVRRIEETLGYPCFVKPANLGS